MKVNFKAILFTIFCSLFGANIAVAQKDSILEVGIALYNKGEYEKSAAVLEKRLDEAKSAHNLKLASVICNNLGNDYTNMGNSKAGLSYYQQALSAAEQSGDKKAIGKCLNNIGTLYSDMKDFDKALQKLGEAEKVAQSINDTATIADCANNIGIVYEQQKRYGDALGQYEKAIVQYNLLGQDDRIAILYNNLGVLYKYMKKYDTSIACYNRSLDLSKKIGSKFLVAANLVNIGNVYEMKGDYKRAIELNKEGLKTGEEIKSNELITEVYDNLAREYALEGDYKQGYDLSRKYAEVKDSFSNIERSKQLAEMQTKFETQKKETRILSLEKSRLLMISLSGFLVLLLVILLQLFNRQKTRQRQEREKAILETERSERTRLAKDLHDDLGSGLSMISMIANRAQMKAGDGKKLGLELASITETSDTALKVNLTEKIIEDNEVLGKEVVQIATVSRELIDNMRDMIWILNPGNTTLDQLISHIREYSQDAMENVSTELSLNLPEDVPELKITREARRNIFLTFKEALNNCLKYASALQLTISIRFGNSGGFEMEISDNGVGFDLAHARSGGNGLKNMKQRIETLGGTYNLDAKSGTKIKIEIPASGLTEHKILL